MKVAQPTDIMAAIAAQDNCPIKRNSTLQCISAHRFAAMLILVDLVIFVLSGLLPVLYYSAVNVKTGALDPDSVRQYVIAVSLATIIFASISRLLNTYELQGSFTASKMLTRSIVALVLTFIGLMIVAIATKISDAYSRVWFFSWFTLSLLLITPARFVLLTHADSRLAKGACLKRALIISCGGSSLSGDQLAIETSNRIRAVGEITVQDLASIPDLDPYLKLHSPHIIILSLPWPLMKEGMSNLKKFSQYAIEVLVLPHSSPGLQNVLRLRRFGSLTLLQFAEPPLRDWDLVVKRIEDILVASLVLVFASPLLILVAFAISLESKGPVLFKQIRVGFNGKLIEVWKFRSMFLEGTDLQASHQTRKNDPRVTRVGRFIRKTSIDELPQCWNVLQGHMSVVGPRPHALGTSAEGKALNAIVEEYAARHRVKPGITGWAQVNGARGELRSRDQVKRRVDFDLHYIENWSLAFDLKVILMTSVRLFHDPNAF